MPTRGAEAALEVGGALRDEGVRSLFRHGCQTYPPTWPAEFIVDVIRIAERIIIPLVTPGKTKPNGIHRLGGSEGTYLALFSRFQPDAIVGSSQVANVLWPTKIRCGLQWLAIRSGDLHPVTDRAARSSTGRSSSTRRVVLRSDKNLHLFLHLVTPAARGFDDFLALTLGHGSAPSRWAQAG
jgi:hypothetical protein